MPRLLLISFHYPPMGVVASERAKAWSEQLSKLGWQVDVLTHHWVHNGKQWTVGDQEDETEEINDHLRIIRLKVEEDHSFSNNPLKRRLRILKDWGVGNLDALPLAFDGYKAMKSWADENVSKGKYDLLMGIYSPHSHIRLCYEIHKNTGIPYHIDFRDLWDNMLVKPGYTPAGTQRIKAGFIERFWKKWLKDCSGSSSVSPAISEYIESEFGLKSLPVFTGYDSSRLKKDHPPTEDFLILYSGSFYKHQHYRKALLGVKQFLDANKDKRIKIEFHGVLRPERAETPGSYSGDVQDEVMSLIQDRRVFVGARIPQEDVRKIQDRAQVLLMPTFRGVKGIISGKFQEYLGTGKRILAIPRDEDAIADALEESGAGVCVDQPFEFAQVLQEWYDEWNESGKLEPLHALSMREKFSQESCARRLDQSLRKHGP